MSRISRRELIVSGALAAGALAGSRPPPATADRSVLVTARLPDGRRLSEVRRVRALG